MSQVNHPGRVDTEVLALLTEECGELVQCVGKCLRHGLDSFNPLDVDAGDNREQLVREIGDVLAAVDIAMQTGLVSVDEVEHATKAKLQRVGRWLHYVAMDPDAREGR